MTIDKAIGILADSILPPTILEGTDLLDALTLGIEALKRVKGNRYPHEPYIEELLLGETEDA